MYKNLRWKVLTILAVFVVFFSVGVYPMLADHYHWPCPGFLKEKQLKLGLDLKGGVHLQIKVNTDDALRITSTSISEQLRDSLKTAGINYGAVNLAGSNGFRVEGIPADRDAQFRQSADEIASTNYDRNPLPAGVYEFRMKPNIERDLREQAVEQAMQTIDRRVNELGVTEPTIARQPQGEEILVHMPGVSHVARANEIMGKDAFLEFKLVEAGPAAKEDLLKQYNGTLPADLEILPGSASASDPTSSSFFVAKKIAPVTGTDLRVAKPGLDENNQPAVHFEL